VVLVKATLTINTIEGTHLAVWRQEIDAQREPQTTAMNGAENGRRIDYCTHNGGKGSENVQFNNVQCAFFLPAVAFFSWFTTHYSLFCCNFAVEFDFYVRKVNE
jgi:hypothetical protein